MNRKILLGAVAASLVTVLAACGDSGSSGPSFPDSVSTADAQDAASNSVGFTSDIMSTLSFGQPGFAAPMDTRLLAYAAAHGSMVRAPRAPYPLDVAHPAQMSASLQLAASEGCTVTSHGSYGIGGGSPVDVNANGIPDNLGFRVECLQTDSTSSPDTVFTSHIIEDISIVERMGDLYGYDERLLISERHGDSFGNFGQLVEDITLHNSINSGNANSALSVTVTQDSTQDSTALHQQFGDQWSANFTPAAAITLGDPLPNGALTLTGRLFVLDPTASSYSFSLNTPTALAYDASCAAAVSNPPFTAGEIDGHLNGNGSSANFTATFTACGVAPTISTNGTFASATP